MEIRSSPTEDIPCLMYWWGLCGQRILTVMLKLTHPIQDRTKVMTQIKRDTLVLQVEGWAWGWWPHLLKT